MILDQELNGDLLAGRIQAYVADRSKIERMAAAAARDGATGGRGSNRR